MILFSINFIFRKFEISNIRVFESINKKAKKFSERQNCIY